MHLVKKNFISVYMVVISLLKTIGSDFTAVDLFKRRNMSNCSMIPILCLILIFATNIFKNESFYSISLATSEYTSVCC